MQRRRIITRVIVFLLLGAIVNVAVAWVPTWENAYFPSRFGPLPASEADAIWAFRRPADWPGAWKGSRRDWYPRWTFDQVMDTEFGAEKPNVIVRVRSGWPLRGMEGFQRITQASRTNSNPQGISIESQLVIRSGQGASARYVAAFPLRPLAWGTVANTLFYAAIIWLVSGGPFALRRWRRSKRGLCPACAYPVGDSPVCTECGKPVSLRPAGGV